MCSLDLTAFGDIDLNGVAVSCHSMPMFHALGMFQISAAARITFTSSILFCLLTRLFHQTISGCFMTTFPPASPPIFPTAETVFEGAKATGADLIAGVPSFLEVRAA